MPQTAQEVCNLHRMQKYEPVLRGVHGTYLFDIDKVGSWFVAVDDGVINIEEKKRDADGTISCDESENIRRPAVHRPGRPALHCCSFVQCWDWNQ